MRDVFVGTLCVIGFFLLSYRPTTAFKEYEGPDNVVGNWACLFAVGVALFPTTPDNPAPGDPRFIGYIHLTFATLFFLSLIYFSLFLFTKRKSEPATITTKAKEGQGL